MKIYIDSRRKLCKFSFIAFILFVCNISTLAMAELGGKIDTVQKDSVFMKGQIKTTQTGLYTVHEITANNGTVVREYVSANGVVFGVAWKGHFEPDLQNLFGAYFGQYSEAAKAERENQAGRRKPLHINKPGLVVHQLGHMRAYSGRAYIPGLVPGGVDNNEIK